jgi:SAM-dependent methyltransferase
MRVLATDISAEMVEHVQAYGIEAIEAKVMDGEALEIDDESIDAAFSMFGVTLFDDWRQGFKELHRVLRPGGIAAVGTWTSLGGAGAVRGLYLLCEELFPGTLPPNLPSGVVEMQSPERFERAMLDAGFVDVRICYEQQIGEIHPHDLDNPDQIFSYSTQWPLLNEAQQRRVVVVMRERFSSKGTYEVESTAGIALGRRPTGASR